MIGGTGFLGRRITAEFVRSGDVVAVLSRGQRAVDALGPVERLQADRHDLDALRGALGERSFDVVVDNVAFDADDVSTTLDVLNGRAGHYLLTSSAAVYADRYVRRPLQEHAADLSLRTSVDGLNSFHPRLGHAYANGKRAAEQATCQSAFAWTVLRLPVVLGADDRTLRVWWFVQRLMDGQPLLIPEWGAGRIFHVAWTHDVARAFAAAAANPSAFGRTYNVAQAELYTAESWIEVAAGVLGVRPRYAHIPEDDLARAGLTGYTLPIAGRPFGHVLLDVGAIRHELGFEPSPESVWLSDTLMGSAANPPAASSAGYERRDHEARVAETLLRQRSAPR
ncbi:MAG: NAD-dependent epimerase/dehydratase family protein [Chloroflexi bacterium]|nr:NAD-dependent epimerase/dehydratase family protein [Chloroflexota bacterium]